MWSLYHRIGDEPITKIWTINHWENIKQSQLRHYFFSRGSRTYRHTSPRCVDQHLVVWWLKGVTWTSSSVGHLKNLPTVEVAQWHAQFTRVTFGAPPRKAQEPLTLTRRWPGTITNSWQCSSTSPSHLGVAIIKSNKNSVAQMISKCH